MILPMVSDSEDVEKSPTSKGSDGGLDGMGMEGQRQIRLSEGSWSCHLVGILPSPLPGLLPSPHIALLSQNLTVQTIFTGLLALQVKCHEFHHDLLPSPHMYMR